MGRSDLIIVAYKTSMAYKTGDLHVASKNMSQRATVAA